MSFRGSSTGANMPYADTEEARIKKRARNRRYWEAHKKEINFRSAIWAKSHREQINARRRLLHKKNPNQAWEYNLQRYYGLTIEQYRGLLEKQNGQCAICGTTEAKGRGRMRNRFYVDHSHQTGKIRGLLCHHCNMSLGGFRDSVVLLRSAIGYLERLGA